MDSRAHGKLASHRADSSRKLVHKAVADSRVDLKATTSIILFIWLSAEPARRRPCERHCFTSFELAVRSLVAVDIELPRATVVIHKANFTEDWPLGPASIVSARN